MNDWSSEAKSLYFVGTFFGLCAIAAFFGGLFAAIAMVPAWFIPDFVNLLAKHKPALDPEKPE
jgi:hypothetical protein